MRTLAFACKDVTDTPSLSQHLTTSPSQHLTTSASQLRFLGIAAIADPVRKEVPESIKECLKAGISVKIVTGDTAETAKEIGRQVGLWTDKDTGKNIINGPEFAALTDAQLDAVVMKIKIISRARPMDKRRLVEALQRKNQ